MQLSKSFHYLFLLFK